ncbi:dCTP deaminase [Aquifex aeolicus]|uniref:dCTP deaminase, dUMP-forming n=1 Tax=Aquifex aeolicus (strain VF5) TaxID=224324 RepID=DCDB_AQUAE|nr:dCTP deaminase [Aquifex aeolicus]O67539.1 RecName: Full=dCTP deaminase, dUMP-forming; AltName: Full=Bifunctional dCTP deaminase:dUTPase; AltName: Full=DCD-DUT [Aquifex aeolicus VF5]AAC07499.1 deoxycytidine triphosphate deaminase [Aquifex aeolicus VF5]
MILSDRSIRELIEKGELKVEPYEPSHVQCSSLDLRLGNQIALYEGEGVIDVKKGTKGVRILEFEEYFDIMPKQFLLATTLEYISLPPYVTAFVEGRSSLGRLGLFIENAGWVDAGFEGQITLELFNANDRPIRLYRGMRICQLVFARLDRPPERVYSGKYKGQKGVVPSRIHMDEELKSE